MKKKLTELKGWILAGAVVMLASVSLEAGPPPATNLVINEILFNDPNGLDRPGEYIELRGTPGGAIPAGTYLVNIEGDEQQGQGAGDVQSLFDLSGIVLGSEGFLTILMESNTYTVDAGSTSVTGTAGGADGYDGAAGFGSDGITQMEQPSMSFLLINAPSAPTLVDDIDGTDGGTADDGIPTGTIYDSWTVLDSVAIADDAVDAGADIESVCYGKIIFVQDLTPENIALKTEPGATLVETGDMEVHYIARIGNSTGSDANDWVAGTLSGTAPHFTLAAGGTFPDSLEGYALNHIGAPNFVCRPDNQIGDKASNLKGDGTYNTSGAGQKVKQVTTTRKTLKYFFKVESDGVVDDSVTIRGTKGNAKFDAKYLVDGEGNMTAAITAGTYAKALAPGQMTTGKVKVKPTKKTEKTSRKDLKRKKRVFNLDVRSNIDASERDRNTFISKTK